MKVFLVYADRYFWDEYDSVVVVDESKEAVLSKFVTDEWGMRHLDNIWFSQSQGEIHVEEVDLMKPNIVLASFRAG